MASSLRRNLAIGIGLIGVYVMGAKTTGRLQPSSTAE